MTPKRACKRSSRSAIRCGATARHRARRPVMDFAYDDTTLDLQQRVLAFMDECVYPAEPQFRAEAAALENRWNIPPVLEELKLEARRRGLWNLFLPRTHAA